MSSAPPDPRGPASPARPAGRPAAPASGRAGPGRGDSWLGIAARYGPAVAVAAAMTVSGLWGLARDSAMGNDEVATRWAALLGLPQLGHLLSHVDAVHGLYYLLIHGWVVVGSSPAALRVPSVIAMAAAAALMVILGRRLSGSGWVGLLAGLVMVTTPMITFYAQTARSYAMVFACVLAATLALLHALEAEVAGAATARRRWLLYGGLVTLSGYLNEMALLVLAAHGVTVLLARYRRRVFERWVIASAVAAALTLPLVVMSLTEHGAVSWIPRPTPVRLLELFHDYFGATNVVALIVVACAVVALAPPVRGLASGRPGAPAGPAGPGTALPWWRAGGISVPSVALPLLVIPAGMLITESYVTHPLFVDRYVLYGEAGAALLAGAGLARIGQWLSRAVHWRALIVVPGAVACVCLLLLQLGPQQRIRTPGSRLFDFGGPARYVGANARAGDGILYFDTLFRKIRLGYPEDFRQTTDFAQAVSPTRAGDFRGVDKPFPLVLQLMPRYRRIWVVGRVPSANLGIPALRQESLLLLRDFTLAARHHFHHITVTLWLRR